MTSVKPLSHGFWTIAGILALATFIVFGVSLWGDFLTWDDATNIVQNPLFQARNYGQFWVESYYGLYIPLTYTVWNFIYGLSSPPSPALFHLLNLLSHLGNSLLVFLILEKIWQRYYASEKNPPATLLASLGGALLFCVHPLQVETVAWITGFRDLLSTNFALASIYVFLGSRNWKGTLASALLYTCGLFAKPGMMMVPAVIFLIEFSLYRKKAVPLIGKLLIFAILGAPILYYTKQTQPDEQFTHWVAPLLLRPVIAMDALGFYITKLLFPYPLVVDYTRISKTVLEYHSYIWNLLVVIFTGLGLWWMARKWSRIPVLGFLSAAILIFPVLGFIAYAFQAISNVADHYIYLPFLGISMAVAYLLIRYPGKQVWTGVITVLLLCSAWSLVRSTHWLDNQSLFTHWVQDNPLSEHGVNGLAGDAFTNKRLAEAERLYRRSLEINPLNPITIANLGITLLNQGRPQEAFDLIDTKMKDPGFYPFNRTKLHALAADYYVASMALMQLGKLIDSYPLLCNAVKLQPQNPEIVGRLQKIQSELTSRGIPFEECK